MTTTTTKTEYYYEVAVPVYVTQTIYSETELTRDEILKKATDGCSAWMVDDIEEWAEDVIATSPEKVEIESLD